MKKYMYIVFFVCLACLLVTGCADKGSTQPETNKTNTQERSKNGGVDLDLTAMSSTMVYAEVYNIMTYPDDYMGKTIKINGSYNPLYSEDTQQYYHYVIIVDAASCCQSGLEFVWSGEHTYPEDYPEEETKIEVTGIFGSYNELGTEYCYLAVNSITVLE